MPETPQAPVTWWRIDKHCVAITPMPVWKERTHYLFLGSESASSRALKMSSYESYYRTYTEARTALIQREADRYENLMGQIIQSRKDFDAALRLDESPKETDHG